MMGLVGAAFAECERSFPEKAAGANGGAAYVKVKRPTSRRWTSRRVDPLMTLASRLRGVELGSE